ncbi:hypothetical protein P20652_4001 [Pseudoalteromonas sp. BSi20652]|uniref:DUF3019 domain-containing protein n=1 Tax=Pseudoalteromonas sp. BSi20652 TaxID=388384 RepID=UPI000231B0F2|nr:DUF3019 domain-containing protein [Pseudoalteromonas sp. BSi20652]GAA62106.1 hypothetical protein P20652_4001 [Pseudoalteromonas sp. BSi20652]
MKYPILIVFIGSLFSGNSNAQATIFSISPKVCVVSEQQDFCDLDLQFNWQLNTTSDVCLYKKKEQLYCGQQQSSGQFNYKARVQVETIYSLINPHTGGVLAKTKIEVQSAHAKKNRRRLRSPWSFF